MLHLLPRCCASSPVSFPEHRSHTNGQNDFIHVCSFAVLFIWERKRKLSTFITIAVSTHIDELIYKPLVSNIRCALYQRPTHRPEGSASNACPLSNRGNSMYMVVECPIQLQWFIKETLSKCSKSCVSDIISVFSLTPLNFYWQSTTLHTNTHISSIQ